MIEPLDRYTVNFYLNFGGVQYQIAEPVGLDGSDFTLSRENGRLGIDVFFASGEANLSFYPGNFNNGLNHQFDKLLAEYKENGFEALVEFIVEVDGQERVMGELDFKTAETDELTYFNCKVIQETAQARLKRREEVKVDLLASENVDGEPITPLTPTKVFIKAVPQNQTAQWEAVEDLADTMLLTLSDYAISFTPQITQSEIISTLSPLQKVTLKSATDVEFFSFIEAEDALSEATLTFEGFAWDFTGAQTQKIEYRIGAELGDPYDGNTVETDIPATATGYSTTLSLPNIERGQKLFIWFRVTTPGAALPYSISGGSITLNANATALSSVTDAFRIGDVMRQVVKSVSGLNINAPRFTSGGEFYDQFITKGTFLRGITDQPFNVSLKDLREWMREVYGDYQIVNSSTVFFGRYPDFYTDNELGQFYQVPDTTYKSRFSEDYAINQFRVKWKKYERENDQNKAREGVNTSAEWLLPNERVENTKEVNIGFSRDAFLIEKTRKDAIRVTENTATREDSDVFILDCLQVLDQTQSEAVNVQHVLVTAGLGGTIRLVNDSSFNWTLLGFATGSLITVSGALNAGAYIVNNIQPTWIQLTAIGATAPADEGYALSGISYPINVTGIKARTNEGFTVIENTTSTSGFMNMRFSPIRVLWNYYGQYLRAACSYRKAEGLLRNTDFIHNGDLLSRYVDDTHPYGEEDQDIRALSLPQEAVTPKEVEFRVLCDFTTFWALSVALREQRGYITILDNTGGQLPVYPNEIRFDWELGVLNGVGLVKHVVADEGDKEPIPPIPEVNVGYLFEDDEAYLFEDGETFIFN